MDNPAKLSELSNYSIHSASIYQDADSISIAVVMYALSKMISRYELRKFKSWKIFYPRIIKEIGEAKADLEKENYQGFRRNVKDIMELLSKADKDLKLYIQRVLEKAKIKKGTNLYERGLSVESAAKLMGISVWEMMNYIGKTRIIDEYELESDVKSKIETARQLFGFK
ncbi:hypothetical protein KY311_00350 [Candidatus Woesearchaeota archaeon]|nr:hypothetical protein [Candidatus Woesearchaeota archaeon]MBW3016800.1 hypothetical protein [Candidatus Woesearchaeota archaeon]